MKQSMNIRDMIEEISDRTGMYRKYVKEVLTVLEQIILENITSATLDTRSECRFVRGITIGGYVMPEREVRDPRNGETVRSPEKFIPYCRFSQSLRRGLKCVDVEEDESEEYM